MCSIITHKNIYFPSGVHKLRSRSNRDGEHVQRPSARLVFLSVGAIECRFGNVAVDESDFFFRFRNFLFILRKFDKNNYQK